MDILDAATHADPYPYYASLRARGGLTEHPEAGVWAASSAEAVSFVLSHPACRVRPVDQPVPAALGNGLTAQLFGRLMRMNDGPPHRCPRQVFQPALAWDPAYLVEALADDFLAGLPLLASAEAMERWMFEFPVTALGRLLGFEASQGGTLATLTRTFVACLSSRSGAGQLRAAEEAAEHLQRLMGARLGDDAGRSPLLRRLHRDAEDVLDEEGVLANLIGLLAQTCEATAGLIGNAVVALAREPGLQAEIASEPGRVDALMAEVLRFDPPVQNTRRFLATPLAFQGVCLPEGATVLVLLASANRDPALNVSPDRFLLDRPDRQGFGFGADRHRCPGQTLALAIARAVLTRLTPGLDIAALLVGRWRYRPSLNGRMPAFLGGAHP